MFSIPGVKYQKGASVVEYAILLMIMGVLAIPLGLKMAESNQSVFTNSDVKIAGVIPNLFSNQEDIDTGDGETCEPDYYSFYDFDFRWEYGTVPGTSFTYNQEAIPSGKAIITDNANGKPGQFFTDDDGGEAAVGDFVLGSAMAYGLSTDAERVWTLRDTVNGDEFQAVQLDIGNVIFPGYYTLSEIAFVPGREYEILFYSATPNYMTDDMAFKYSDFVGYCPTF